MKSLLALTLGLLLSIWSYAQNGGKKTTKVEWNGIKLEENIVIGITFDVTEATFGGLSYEDRCEVDPELKTDFQDAVARCANAANKLMQYYYYNIYFSPKTEGKDYYIVFKVLSVDTYGWTNADAKLVTPGGVATFTNLTGKGGTFGTFVNLMGDGFESLGKDVVKRIAKAKEKKKI